jgi:hypothetical protein
MKQRQIWSVQCHTHSRGSVVRTSSSGASCQTPKPGLCCNIPAARKRTCACRQRFPALPLLLAGGRPARRPRADREAEPGIEVPEAGHLMRVAEELISGSCVLTSGYDARPGETTHGTRARDLISVPRIDPIWMSIISGCQGDLPCLGFCVAARTAYVHGVDLLFMGGGQTVNRRPAAERSRRVRTSGETIFSRSVAVRWSRRWRSSGWGSDSAQLGVCVHPRRAPVCLA